MAQIAIRNGNVTSTRYHEVASPYPSHILEANEPPEAGNISDMRCRLYPPAPADLASQRFSPFSIQERTPDSPIN